jgi:hypothetical protein
MVQLLRHRQTKGAVTDRPDVRPPRHISTLPIVRIQHLNNKPPLAPWEKNQTPINHEEV